MNIATALAHRWERLRFEIRIQKIEGRRRLVIHESQRRAVKLLKHGITTVGLASAFVVFSSAWIAFGVAAILEVLGSGAERMFFPYRDLYIQPLPDFLLEPEKWIGMGFGYTNHPEKRAEVPVVMMVVADHAYARNLHRLFDSWCYGRRVDSAKCISASVIVQGGEYFFIVYPSPERPTARNFFKERARHHQEADSVQDRILIHLTLAKGFLITTSSYLPTFRKRFREGEPVIFQVEVLPPDSTDPTRVGSTFWVLHSFRIRDRAQLTPLDFEYAFLRGRA